MKLSDESGWAPLVYFNRQVPFWREEGGMRGRNAWEYFFRPVSGLELSALRVETSALESFSTHQMQERLAGAASVSDEAIIGDVIGANGRLTTEQRVTAFRLIEKHIAVRPEILTRVDQFWKTSFLSAPIVGVHYRGTDKRFEAPMLPFGSYLRGIEMQIREVGAGKVLVATDTEQFLDYIRAHLPVPVVSLEMERSRDGRPLHFGNSQNAEDALVEVLLLSRCDAFVHGVSNMSAAALAFNLGLRSQQINA